MTVRIGPKDGIAIIVAFQIDDLPYRTTGRPTLPQGAVLGDMAADPAGRADGWIWFNATAQRLRRRTDGVDFNLDPFTVKGVLVVADNALEASSIVAAPGVTPTSIITASLAPFLDADENSPELLDLVNLWTEAGTDQITLTAPFPTLPRVRSKSTGVQTNGQTVP